MKRNISMLLVVVMILCVVGAIPAAAVQTLPVGGWVELDEMPGITEYIIEERYDVANGTSISGWGNANTAAAHEGKLHLQFANSFIFEKMFTSPVTSGKLVTQFEMKLLSGSLNQFPIVEDGVWGNSLGKMVMAGGFKPNGGTKVANIIHGNEYGIRMITNLDEQTFKFYIYDFTEDELVYESTDLSYNNPNALNQVAGLFLQGYEAGEALFDNFLVYKYQDWQELPELEGNKTYHLEERYTGANGTAVSGWGNGSTGQIEDNRLNLNFGSGFITERMFPSAVTSGSLITQFEFKLQSGSLNQFPIVQNSSWGAKLFKMVLNGSFVYNSTWTGDYINHGDQYAIRIITHLDEEKNDLTIWNFTTDGMEPIFELTDIPYDDPTAFNQAAGLFLQGNAAGELILDNLLAYTIEPENPTPTGLPTENWVDMPVLGDSQDYLVEQRYNEEDGTIINWGNELRPMIVDGKMFINTTGDNDQNRPSFIHEIPLEYTVLNGKVVTQFEIKRLDGGLLNQFPILEDGSWGKKLTRIMASNYFRINDVSNDAEFTQQHQFGIRIVTDLDTKTNDYYIFDYTDDEIAYQETDVAFEDVTGERYSNIFFQGNQPGQWLMDNLLVYTYAEESPTPTPTVTPTPGPAEGWIDLAELSGTKTYLIQERFNAANGTSVSGWGNNNTAVTYENKLEFTFAGGFIFEKMFTTPVTDGLVVTQFEMKMMSGTLNQFPIVQDASWGRSLGRMVLNSGFKPNNGTSVGAVVPGRQYGVRMIANLNTQTFDFYVKDFATDTVLCDYRGLAYENAQAANQVAGLFLQGDQAGKAYFDNFLVYTMDAPAMPTMPQAGQALELYVATNGNDLNSGEINAPLKSLAGARSKIAIIKSIYGLPDGAVVYFREGNYTINSTVAFGEADSGNEDGWITYTNYPNEDVSFNGAYVLPGGQFAAVIDTDVLNRLQTQDAKSNVKQIDLAAAGVNVKALGGIQKENPFTGAAPATTALSVDGEQQVLARWPNVDGDGGFARFSEVSGKTFTCFAPNLSKWQNVDEIYLRGYFGFNWFDNTSNIVIQNVQTGRVTVTDATDNYGIANNMRYFIMNALEELDTPGEYYIDRNAGMMYYWPDKNIANSDITLTKLSSALINMNGASYIEFEGIRFADSRGEGFRMEETDHITIENCTFYNLGIRAVSASFENSENGGANNNNITITDCDINCMGKGGIDIDGGNLGDLTYSNNLIENCKIHDYNRAIFSSMPGVHIRGVGNTVRNNEIFDAPQGALWFKGALHLVEKNEIHDVVKWASDAGAVYGGASWHERGTVFQNNEFYDIWGYDDAHYPTIKPGANGIYFDDIMSGNIVTNNIFHDMDNGIFAHGGSDVVSNNNIFYHVAKPIEYHIIQGLDNAQLSRQDNKWVEVMERPDFDSQIWYATFPQLEGLLSDPNRWKPRNNVATNNLMYLSGITYPNGTGIGGYSSDNTDLIENVNPNSQWNTWPYYVIDQNVRYSKLGYQNGMICTNNWTPQSDPGFVSIANRNFMLTSAGLLTVQSNIPAFENIDTSVIGNN